MLNKICNFISTLIVVILVFIAAAMFIPKLFGYDEYVVLSGSMEPNIHVGAIVYDKNPDVGSLQVGDVITYKLDASTMVTHRIIEIDATHSEVITQGDANDSADGAPVAFNQIVGVYEFNIPYLGYINMYFKTPLGIAVICGVLVVMILLNVLPEVFKSDKEENK